MQLTTKANPTPSAMEQQGHATAQAIDATPAVGLESVTDLIPKVCEIIFPETIQRSSGIGGSDCAAVLGLSPYETAADVWLRKVGMIPDKEANDLMMFGTCIEPGIVRLYQMLHGIALVYPQPMRRHAAHEFMLATPDAQSPTDNSHGYELKSMDWRIAKAIHEQGLDDVVPHYVCQAQQQMAVMDWDRVTLVALVDRKLEQWTIPRNDEMIAMMVEVERDFWGMVQRREQPAVDYSHKHALETIKHLYRGVRAGVTIQLSPTASAAYREYEQLGQIAKGAEAKRKELKARWLDEIGDAHAGVLDTGDRMIRRSVVAATTYTANRKEYVMARAAKYDGSPIVARTPETAGVEESDDSDD